MQQEQAFWSIPAGELELGSSTQQGLTSKEASNRLSTFGKNSITAILIRKCCCSVSPLLEYSNHIVEVFASGGLSANSIEEYLHQFYANFEHKIESGGNSRGFFHTLMVEVLLFLLLVFLLITI